MLTLVLKCRLQSLNTTSRGGQVFLTFSAECQWLKILMEVELMEVEVE
jgi:hypothetical protein